MERLKESMQLCVHQGGSPDADRQLHRRRAPDQHHRVRPAHLLPHGHATRMSEVDVHASLEMSLNLLRNQYKNRIEIHGSMGKSRRSRAMPANSARCS